MHVTIQVARIALFILVAFKTKIDTRLISQFSISFITSIDEPFTRYAERYCTLTSDKGMFKKQEHL